MAKRGRPPLPPKVWQEREERVLELRKNGFSQRAIAEKIDLSNSVVQNITHRLICAGRCEWPRNDSRYELANERSQTITRMKKERATLREIGAKLGITSERVRQIVARMTTIYGGGIFEPERTLFTSGEVSAQLGIPRTTLGYLYRKGKIPFTRRPGSREFLLTEESLSTIAAYPSPSEERVCEICGKQFVTKHVSPHTSCFVCRYWLAKKRGLRPESLTGWRQEVRKKIAAYDMEPDTKMWLTLTSAVRRAGISRMQFLWLVFHGVFTTRPHPTKLWRGRPVTIYAESEMDIVREVRRVFQRAQ